MDTTGDACVAIKRLLATRVHSRRTDLPECRRLYTTADRFVYF